MDTIRVLTHDRGTEPRYLPFYCSRSSNALPRVIRTEALNLELGYQYERDTLRLAYTRSSEVRQSGSLLVMSPYPLATDSLRPWRAGAFTYAGVQGPNTEQSSHGAERGIIPNFPFPHSNFSLSLACSRPPMTFRYGTL